MALDRLIALVILCVCLAYGYTAFFLMDANLAPFMRRNPIWPSTFPKVLSVFAILTCLVIVLGLEKAPSDGSEKQPEIDYRRLHEYKWGQALLLLALMVVYALCLRPVGFIVATIGFLMGGSIILGERNWIVMGVASAVATGVIWYLVQGVLGIYLRPLPEFIG